MDLSTLLHHMVWKEDKLTTDEFRHNGYVPLQDTRCSAVHSSITEAGLAKRDKTSDGILAYTWEFPIAGNLILWKEKNSLWNRYGRTATQYGESQYD